MSAGFSKDVLALFDREQVVDMETRSPNGTQHSVPIWIVVARDVPYVRSVRGPRGRWYRELLARGDGAVVAGRKRVAVRATHDSSPKTIAAVSEALRRKYPRSGQSLASMLRVEVLDTTVRLEPAA
ncbi:MAG TPA: DUF2255 family protein [Candidatus Limnocylindria bacterium]|nr:DUF2255 family protein [Candidatus Limnocylindria bacterium]